MKKATTSLIPLFVLMFARLPAVAQPGFVAEGFASINMVSDSIAQRELTGLRRDNPEATLELAILNIAKRTARTDATRNMVEYLRGIHFTYRSGKLERKMQVTTQGAAMLGNCTYRELDSGIIVAMIDLHPSEEERGIREGLPVYSVTGVCSDESVGNMILAIQKAKMDAFEKAIRQAVSDEDPSALETDHLFQGTVYIVKTVNDTPGIPYNLEMLLQVRLEK